MPVRPAPALLARPAQLRKCLRRMLAEVFRDEMAAAAQPIIDGQPDSDIRVGQGNRDRVRGGCQRFCNVLVRVAMTAIAGDLGYLEDGQPGAGVLVGIVGAVVEDQARRRSKSCFAALEKRSVERCT